MRRRWSALVVAAAAAAGTGAGGCQAMNTPLYFNGTGTLTAEGMPGAPATVKDSITLRFRNPSDKERMELSARQTAAAPVKVPWISRDNVHLEVLFTVKNISDQRGYFNVTVDGATEYLAYDQDVVAAAFAANDQNGVTLPLMQLRPRQLEPGAVFRGTIREDDFAEAEADLNALDQFMAPVAAVLINRSDVNPVGLEMVPPGAVVPALIQVDVRLITDQKMECEYLLRVRDDEDQLLHESKDTRYVPTPTVFQPTFPATP